MTVAIVQHGHNSGNGGTPKVTLGVAPTVGNLLIAFFNVNTGNASATIGGSWTQFEITSPGLMYGLYRYVQVGDLAALPVFATAGFSFWSAEVYEISGVSGTFATDVAQHESAAPAGTTSMTTTAMTTAANGEIGLIGFANYDDSGATATISAGWTLDESTMDATNYGAFGCASRSFPSSGSSVQATITFAHSFFPGYVALRLGPGAATETGTGTLTFGGIGFSASATDKTKTIFITSGTTWAVPADFNTVANKFFALGAGGSGANAVANTAPGASGGSGGYSSATNINLTPGSTVAVQIGVGGGNTLSGNDTFLKDNNSTVAILAQSGGNAVAGAAGAAAGTARAVGTVKRAGTAGHAAAAASASASPGGAGAPGPSALGGAGGQHGSGGASGGGGANGGSVGGVGSSTVGGAGGTDGLTGAGAGAGATSTTNAGNGTNGAGGGGGSSTNGHANGGSGASETLWLQSSDGAIAGPSGGGGGGGSGSTTAGSGGSAGYGGGGGGAGCNASTAGTAGTGGAGIIVVQYIPAENATGTLAFSGIGFTDSGAVLLPSGNATLHFAGISLVAAAVASVPGTASLHFGGISLVASGTVIVTGTATLHFSGISLTGAGIVKVTGTSSLHFAGLSIVAAGSDITAPIPPTPPPATVKKFAVDPLTWNVPIVNPDGTPKLEFQQKWNKQNSVNGGIVPQGYIDGQDASNTAASQQYTQDYGATVLVAAKVYTDSAPPNALPSYTVATLPAAPTVGKQAIVTDALAPTYLAAVVGGGAVVAPVMWNGTNWVCH